VKSLLLFSLAITHVMVINTTGGPPLRDATVIVRDGRIAEIGSAKPPQDADILDGSGKSSFPACGTCTCT